MTIRFKCPSCKRSLSVKDHLAGKKAACPACKKPLVIPKAAVPVAPPANIEELAASAFADAPPAAAPPPKQAKAIHVACPWCGEEHDFPAEAGGKQEPCPECKRIIKIPKPVEEKPRDWRDTTRTGPTGAKQATPEQLVGATTKGRVSREALEEAGALPEIEVEPLTTAEIIGLWTKRVFVWTLVVAGFAGAWYGLRSQQVNKQQKEDVGRALEYVEPKSKLTPEWTAEIHRAAGEFYLHAARTKENKDKAVAHFRKALAQFPKLQPVPPAVVFERDLFLTDLALSQIELGGLQDETDKARLDWKNEMQKELSHTLQAISSSEGRLTALREVSTRLLDKGQGALALSLVLDLSPAQAPAAAGKQVQRSPIASQQIALLFAMYQPDKAAALFPLPKAEAGPLDLALRLGWAEGKAREGNFNDARQFALEKGPPLHRFQAALAVAAIAVQQSKTAEASACVEDAVKVLNTELIKKAPPPLLQLELARIVVIRTEPGDKAKALIEAISDPYCKARAELEVFYQPPSKELSQADLDLIKNEKALAYAQAVEALARQKTRQGQRDEVLATVEKKEEQLRPFIYMGVALGELDHR